MGVQFAHDPRNHRKKRTQGTRRALESSGPLRPYRYRSRGRWVGIRKRLRRAWRRACSRIARRASSPPTTPRTSASTNRSIRTGDVNTDASIVTRGRATPTWGSRPGSISRRSSSTRTSRAGAGGGAGAPALRVQAHHARLQHRSLPAGGDAPRGHALDPRSAGGVPPSGVDRYERRAGCAGYRHPRAIWRAKAGQCRSEPHHARCRNEAHARAARRLAAGAPQGHPALAEAGMPVA